MASNLAYARLTAQSDLGSVPVEQPNHLVLMIGDPRRAGHNHNPPPEPADLGSTIPENWLFRTALTFMRV